MQAREALKQFPKLIRRLHYIRSTSSDASRELARGIKAIAVGFILVCKFVVSIIVGSITAYSYEWMLFRFSSCNVECKCTVHDVPLVHCSTVNDVNYLALSCLIDYSYSFGLYDRL